MSDEEIPTDDFHQTPANRPRPSEGAPEEAVSVSWSHASTALLISTYADLQHLFTSSTVRKQQVWQKTAAILNEEGHMFSAEQCDKKWRSLRYRYYQIIERNSCRKTGRRKWEWFYSMDKILAVDPAVQPEITTSPMTGDASQSGSPKAVPEKAASVSWSHAATALLIATYADHKPLFTSSAVRKQQVWQKIAAKLNGKGHSYSAEQCDKKWRSLRYRYFQIVEGNSCSGTGHRKWEWFDSMDNILAGEPDAQPEMISSVTGAASHVDSPNAVQELAVGVSWSPAATAILIATYADHKPLFTSSTVRKQQVWQKVAAKLNGKGHSYSAEQCDKKWRSLRYRYFQIVEGNSCTGTGRRKWEWFDSMDNILAGEDAVQPETATSSGAASQPGPSEGAPEEAVIVSWSHAAIALLIATYVDLQQLFTSSTVRKQQVWQKIAAILNEEGHFYSAEQCDKKWRSLRYRYFQIVAGNLHTGTRRRKWEWFDSMDKILAGDCAVHPETTTSSVTGVVTKSALSPSEDGETASSSSSSTPCSPPTTPKLSPRKRRRSGHDSELPQLLEAFQKEAQETSQKLLEVLQERNRILQQIADGLFKKLGE